MAKNQELNSLDTLELESRLSDAKEELFNLRFQRVTGQLDNTARIGEVKRQVARIMTAIRARQIAEAKAE
ncbi:MAG: 50S ribosomal protein L29 [Acidimicrobiia bacterium]|jgi:large subunit ribosomal protein L29|nr:50S ribosomal protein L29 [Acidimicrobiia bacterium]MBP8181006.1 50S ribosomal protein L29 [Acidimicrobiia bacterium]